MENFPYLFAAYALIWLVLIGYIFNLFLRARQLRRVIDSLKKAMEGKEEGNR